jgi:hypothetical protein
MASSKKFRLGFIVRDMGPKLRACLFRWRAGGAVDDPSPSTCTFTLG